MDFSQLKKNSGKTSLEKLTSELQKVSGNQDNNTDNRFWYPNVDKAGNGYAVIRFLPAPGSESVPFVRIWEHGFKGPTGKWYIEKCLTTIGKNDPVSELNSLLWNSTQDDNSPARKQARDQKRKLGYISNVYVIQDQLNPENNGKVFLFKFGKKIFDKINEAMHPQFGDEDALNPFDFWQGANFKLKIRNVEGYRNYDKSEFAIPSALFDDDTEIENVWNQEHSLQTFLDPSTFKSYDELKTKLNNVLGLVATEQGSKPFPIQSTQRSTIDDDDIPNFEQPKSFKETSPPKISSTSSNEDDDDMEFFKRLAK